MLTVGLGWVCLNREEEEEEDDEEGLVSFPDCFCFPLLPSFALLRIPFFFSFPHPHCIPAGQMHMQFAGLLKLAVASCKAGFPFRASARPCCPLVYRLENPR